MFAITQAPGTMLAYGTVDGAGKMVGIEASTACQHKFTEVQVAWIGHRFMVFARGKLLVDADVKAPRGKAPLALSANNASAHFRDVEIRSPDASDIERIKSGRPVM